MYKPAGMYGKHLQHRAKICHTAGLGLGLGCGYVLEAVCTIASKK